MRGLPRGIRAMGTGKEDVIQTTKVKPDYANRNKSGNQSYHEGGSRSIQHSPANTEQSNQSSGFTKRIGSTTYRVSVRFSQTSKETINDKILRMIRNESVIGREAGK